MTEPLGGPFVVKPTALLGECRKRVRFAEVACMACMRVFTCCMRQAAFTVRISGSMCRPFAKQSQ